MIVFPCFSHMIPFSSHLLYNRCPHARFHTENLGAGGRARETHLLMILLPDKGHKEVEVEGATALLNHFRSMHCCIYVYIIICIYIYIYIFDYFSYILIYNHIYIYICIWLIMTAYDVSIIIDLYLEEKQVTQSGAPPHWPVVSFPRLRACATS